MTNERLRKLALELANKLIHNPSPKTIHTIERFIIKVSSCTHGIRNDECFVCHRAREQSQKTTEIEVPAE